MMISHLKVFKRVTIKSEIYLYNYCTIISLFRNIIKFMFSLLEALHNKFCHMLNMIFLDIFRFPIGDSATCCNLLNFRNTIGTQPQIYSLQMALFRRHLWVSNFPSWLTSKI